MADLIELDQEEHGVQQCEGVCGLFKYKVTSEQVGNVKVAAKVAWSESPGRPAPLAGSSADSATCSALRGCAPGKGGAES
ncbi:hypothetical protein EVAR_96381_1 [Eumeta japonica]|uniref:Uncharacterized protein n=1 Tax=Eumeta variegata TaxID=151549 RepID=A0A4C1WDT2_EUMVA|nr:hypothetical protein EVAR_96381_1 [Eumeta japonica]